VFEGAAPMSLNTCAAVLVTNNPLLLTTKLPAEPAAMDEAVSVVPVIVPLEATEVGVIAPKVKVSNGLRPPLELPLTPFAVVIPIVRTYPLRNADVSVVNRNGFVL